VDPAVAGDKLRLVNGVLVTIEVRDPSAGLAKNNAAACHIPGTQLDFPESVESPGSDITEIQRRASGPAQSLNFQGKSCKVVQIVVRCITNVIGKPVTNNALSRRSVVETMIEEPFKLAPPPA